MTTRPIVIDRDGMFYSRLEQEVNKEINLEKIDFEYCDFYDDSERKGSDFFILHIDSLEITVRVTLSATFSHENETYWQPYEETIDDEFLEDVTIETIDDLETGENLYFEGDETIFSKTAKEIESRIYKQLSTIKI